MPRRIVLAAMCFLLLISIFMNVSRNGVSAASPRRIEVSVTSEGAPAGQSKVTLRWETGSYQLYKLQEIDANGTPNWGTALIYTSAGGYSTYSHNVANYQNHTYRVGNGTPWQEARVYPPNESAHTNYAKNSDTCKGCHRTHYAVHPKLLSEAIILNLCITCHGDGSGSKYNVMDGKVRVASNTYVDSPAGAFGIAATSFHNVFLEEDAFEMVAPGGIKMTLTCTDCHSAHVTDKSSPFRLLKYKDIGPVDAYALTESGGYKTIYRNHMNDFCARCHNEYNYNNHVMDGGIQPHVRSDLDNAVTYRHPTDIDIKGWLSSRGLTIVLPLETRVEGGTPKTYMNCITCHFAHGTTMKGWQITPEPVVLKYDKDGEPIYLHEDDLTEDELQAYLDAGYHLDVDGYLVAPDNEMLPVSTMLKRQENMGICLECHLDIWVNTPADL